MRQGIILIFVICLIAISGTGFALGQENAAAVSEQQVKAALIYNFAKYVRWPEDALPRDVDFTIGILAPDPTIADQLELISARKTISGRKIVIKTFATLDELQPVHILYVGASYSGKVSLIKDALAGKSILSIGEQEDFLVAGGIIQFVTSSEQVRFMVNDREARRSGLKISPELLELADKVY